MKKIFRISAVALLCFCGVPAARAQWLNSYDGAKVDKPTTGTPVSGGAKVWDGTKWVFSVITGTYTPPSGSGFPHITSGAQDGAARAVNVGTGDITGTLPIANGGTGATTAPAAIDLLNQASEASVASASTTDLGAQPSQMVLITGTTTITSFGTVAAGTKRWVRFAAALTLTHNATTLILPGAANITTAAGDNAMFISEGSGNWRCRQYSKADGSALVGGGGGYAPGGTDVAIADGGTGASSASAALDNLFSTAEASVASASTVSLGSQSSLRVQITGTTTITSFGTANAGIWRWVRFASALTLTHNGTSLILPTGASITTAAGDTLVASSEGSGNWRVLVYQRADGTSLALGSSGTGAGSLVLSDGGSHTYRLTTQTMTTDINEITETAPSTGFAYRTLSATTNLSRTILGASAAQDNLVTAEQTIASATTTDLGTLTSDNAQITGTTTITGLGSSAPTGKRYFGRFAASLTFTHNATSLILPGGANITTAAGDRFIARHLGSGNWIVLVYQKADGTAIAGGAGGGDFSSNTSTSVDGEMVQFSGTGGKTGKRATLSGYGKFASGVPTGVSTIPVADGGTGSGTANGAMDGLATAEATVASATTTDLGAVTSQNVQITGTTTITGFGTVAAGVRRWGRFAGALTLTHNATSLILPGNANITTAANDRFQALSLGTGNWIVYNYTKADGTAVVSSGGGGAADTFLISRSGVAVDVVNTTTETAMFTNSVPANTLNTNTTVEIVLDGDFLNDTGSTVTETIKIYYGSTVMFNGATPGIAAASTRKPFRWEIRLMALNSTSSQLMNGRWDLSSGPTSTTTGQGTLNAASPISTATIDGTAAEDSTAVKGFGITVTHTTANASLSMKVKHSEMRVR